MRYRSYNTTRANSIWIIIIVNMVLVIVTMLSQEVMYLLGLIPAAFLSQPWTIITNLFIHAGLWHVFANMLTLYFFGSSLTRLVGEGRFLLVYFAGGILGNIFYLLLGPPLSVVVGASGAVFAIAGALTVLAPRLRVFIFPLPVPIPLWAAVIGGFLLLSFLPHVAWQAHLGGLLLGLTAGYFFKRKMPRYFIA